MVNLKIIKIMAFVVMAMLCCLPRVQSQTTKQILNTREVLKDIDRLGTQKVLDELYNDKDKWDFLLKKIDSGELKWLNIMGKLYKVSDAGSAEQLLLAVGEGLGNNPSSVLKFLMANTLVDLNDVCSGVDVDDPRFNRLDLAVSEIDKRKVSISSVNDKQMLGIRDRCLKQLKASVVGLRKFYGVHSKAEIEHEKN